jgi:hypothetical protein
MVIDSSAPRRHGNERQVGEDIRRVQTLIVMAGSPCGVGVICPQAQILMI